MELFVEEPDREDPRALFEREDLFVVFLDLLVVFLEREFEFDDLDFDDVRRFDPLVDPLPLERARLAFLLLV